MIPRVASMQHSISTQSSQASSLAPAWQPTDGDMNMDGAATGSLNERSHSPPTYLEATGGCRRALPYQSNRQHESSYKHTASVSSRPLERNAPRSMPDLSQQEASAVREMADCQITTEAEYDLMGKNTEEALAFTYHQASPSAAQHKLAQPVVVPQIGKGLGLPFSRAYSPVLAERDISMEEFVDFVDGLNAVSTASPPLAILDLAGGVVSMVPHHIPQIVGTSISVTAKLGTAGVSKGRATVFLKRANADFFAPRGLKVEIASTKAMKAKLGLDPETDIVEDLAESRDLSVVERRLRALSRHVAPLTFDVPPPNQQSNVLDRMSAGQVKRQLAKTEKKALKDRTKALKKANIPISEQEQNPKAKIPKSQKDLEKELAKIEKEQAKAIKKSRKESRSDSEKAERELAKETRKLDKEREKAYRESAKEAKKERKDVVKEDKEIKSAEKVLWLLIEDL